MVTLLTLAVALARPSRAVVGFYAVSFSFPIHYFNDGTAWAQRSEPKFGNQVIAPVEIRFNLTWIVSKMAVGFCQIFFKSVKTYLLFK